MRGNWQIGIVKESAGDMLHLIYAIDETKAGDVWIKTYSDRLAPHKSKTHNEATLLYQKLRRYVESH